LADADIFKAVRRRLKSDLLGKRFSAGPSQRPPRRQPASAVEHRRGISMAVVVNSVAVGPEEVE